MGNQEDHINIDNWQWQQLPNQYYENNFNSIVVKSLKTSIQADQYLFQLPSNKSWKNQKQLYTQRISNSYKHLARVYSAQKQQSQFTCSGTREKIKVQTERILWRLSFENNLSMDQAVYILQGAFNGYTWLNKHSNNLFMVRDSMIGLNRQGIVKVWFNDNFAKNYPDDNQIHITSNRAMTQQIFNCVKDHIWNKEFTQEFQILIEDRDIIDISKIEERISLYFKNRNRQSVKFSLIRKALEQKKQYKLQRYSNIKKSQRSLQGSRRANSQNKSLYLPLETSKIQKQKIMLQKLPQSSSRQPHYTSQRNIRDSTSTPKLQYQVQKPLSNTLTSRVYQNQKISNASERLNTIKSQSKNRNNQNQIYHHHAIIQQERIPTFIQNLQKSKHIKNPIEKDNKNVYIPSNLKKQYNNYNLITKNKGFNQQQNINKTYHYPKYITNVQKHIPIKSIETATNKQLLDTTKNRYDKLLPVGPSINMEQQQNNKKYYMNVRQVNEINKNNAINFEYKYPQTTKANSSRPINNPSQYFYQDRKTKEEYYKPNKIDQHLFSNKYRPEPYNPYPYQYSHKNKVGQYKNQAPYQTVYPNFSKQIPQQIPFYQSYQPQVFKPQPIQVIPLQQNIKENKIQKSQKLDNSNSIIEQINKVPKTINNYQKNNNQHPSQLIKPLTPQQYRNITPKKSQQSSIKKQVIDQIKQIQNANHKTLDETINKKQQTIIDQKDDNNKDQKKKEQSSVNITFENNISNYEDQIIQQSNQNHQIIINKNIQQLINKDINNQNNYINMVNNFNNNNNQNNNNVNNDNNKNDNSCSIIHPIVNSPIDANNIFSINALSSKQSQELIQQQILSEESQKILQQTPKINKVIFHKKNNINQDQYQGSRQLTNVQAEYKKIFIDQTGVQSQQIIQQQDKFRFSQNISDINYKKDIQQLCQSDQQIQLSYKNYTANKRLKNSLDLVQPTYKQFQRYSGDSNYKDPNQNTYNNISLNYSNKNQSLEIDDINFSNLNNANNMDTNYVNQVNKNTEDNINQTNIVINGYDNHYKDNLDHNYKIDYSSNYNNNYSNNYNNEYNNNYNEYNSNYNNQYHNNYNNEDNNNQYVQQQYNRYDINNVNNTNSIVNSITNNSYTIDQNPSNNNNKFFTNLIQQKNNPNYYLFEKYKNISQNEQYKTNVIEQPYNINQSQKYKTNLVDQKYKQNNKNKIVQDPYSLYFDRFGPFAIK